MSETDRSIHVSEAIAKAQAKQEVLLTPEGVKVPKNTDGKISPEESARISEGIWNSTVNMRNDLGCDVRWVGDMGWSGDIGKGEVIPLGTPNIAPIEKPVKKTPKNLSS